MVALGVVFYLFHSLPVHGEKRCQPLAALYCVYFDGETKGDSHEEVERMYVERQGSIKKLVLKTVNHIATEKETAISN